ncbi:hypothetical protein DSM101010T_25880 [Desulfovibrio subterraneus]|uniref:Uncharacterized protein n=1 Tax=Desulfovibrio subterraneus TaxID=2718620 RepID=A0A7J0BKB0_9BACT|nr:hypothetical protein DSM101010T_25880 [Desulfovibrio subterraneus]
MDTLTFALCVFGLAILAFVILAISKKNAWLDLRIRMGVRPDK